MCSLIGNSCRLKVLRSLKNTYSSIEDAEIAFNINYFGSEDPIPTEEQQTSKAVPQSINNVSPVFSCSPSSVRDRPADIIENIVTSITKLTKLQRKQLMQQLFVQYIHEDINTEVPSSYMSSDF